jgi:uncharacterized protein (DUF58 family)
VISIAPPANSKEAAREEAVRLSQPPLLQELKRLKFRARRKISTDLAGGFRTAFRGSGLQFRELRQYEPGDEIRSIQWKASARTGTTYVKTYEEERQLRFHVVVDSSRSTIGSLHGSGREQIAEFATLIALLARLNNDAIALTLVSNTIELSIPSACRRNHIDRIIAELLAPRELRPKTDLAVALSALNARERRRSIIFLISDLFTSPFRDELKLLSRRHDVVVVHAAPPLEAEVPSAGLLLVTDAETGTSRTIDTSSRAGRELYHQALLKRRTELSTMVSDAGADFIEIGESPFGALQALIRQRSRQRGLA